MSKIGESLLKGAEEALEYAKGSKKTSKVHHVKIPKKINVSTIRNKLHMSQNVFAACFGFSIRTIEKWEQGVRQPAGAARAYLIVIDRNPEAVRSALSQRSSRSSNKIHA
ncbi:MAG TPA: type II toxin-antitoxin system MqsA family antitoxin [Gammaproteobacteria bacterium]|jgi:putative transcriptional regulator|nr:type II toxin-antitoxin system MqsA family antitoxin [Gammaproteobacteria bacterium]